MKSLRDNFRNNCLWSLDELLVYEPYLDNLEFGLELETEVLLGILKEDLREYYEKSSS